MKFVPFTNEHLPEAAELLAKRQQRERKEFAELPSTFESPDAAVKALEHEWKQPHCIGIAAFDQDGKMAGYIVGAFTVDAFRGRSAWIKYPGLAISETSSEELYRDLYANIAEQWVKHGCFNHYVLMPAGNPLAMEAWFRLGFAYQQAYALLDLDNAEDQPGKGLSQLHIRQAQKSDRVALMEMAVWNSLHQAQVPAWNPIMPETLAELREGYAGILDDQDAQLWFAVKDQEIVGLHAYWPMEAKDIDMIVPEKCVELSVATTKPSERGHGIGSSLTSYCFKQLKQKGYRYCMTDWYILNLLSSRFWPRRGFRPVMYRLVRKIDERIAWANGES